MSSRIARTAASLSASGAGKLGNPWARLSELCSRASRVIPRITDSRKPWVRRAVVTGAPGKGWLKTSVARTLPHCHGMTPLPFTDLHSHLVPGVDDGSVSVDESLSCLAALRAEGVAALVTTPHLLLPQLATDSEIDRVLDLHRRAFDELAEAALDRTDLPAIGLGQEIWAPDASQIRRLVRRTDVGLGRGRFLLVEFGFDLRGTHEDVVRETVDAGRGIVV